MVNKHKDFHVIIAGGGIAGLTLAASLERAGISFTLLEARKEVAPQVGASFGIFANGGRILGQLGCLDEILSTTTPLTRSVLRKTDGRIYVDNDTIRMFGTRSGLPYFVNDRVLVLKAIAKCIKDGSKLLTNKRVHQVSQTSDGVKVECDDGSIYHGHALIGCDGVSSRVRQEMWRDADLNSPGYIPRSDKTALKAEYQCMYGISSATPGLLPQGSTSETHNKDKSIIYIVSKDSRTYWFAFKRLDRVYESYEIPRFSKEEAKEFASEIADWKLSPTTTFAMLFDNVISYVLTPLEEGDFKRWSYGRIACCGDAMHKITPDSSSGGNMAIESAAVIANEFHRLVNSKAEITHEAVDRALQDYHSIREHRTAVVSKMGGDLTRLHCLQTRTHELVAAHLLPRIGDMGISRFTDIMIGAVKLDFLPVPEWSVQGLQPFNGSAGTGKRESVLKRLLLALPILGLSVLAARIMNVDGFLPSVAVMSKARLFQHGNFSFRVRDSFWGWQAFDDIWRPVTICFMPANFGTDPISQAQLFSFLSCVGPVYSIMLIESARRANRITVWSIIGLGSLVAQVITAARVMPSSLWLAYGSAQIQNFSALDQRLTDMSYTSTVLLSMVICYWIPLVGQFFAPTMEARHTWNWVWQVFPLTISLMQRLLAWTVVPNTVNEDRYTQPLRDLPAIFWQIGISAVASAAVWIYTVTQVPFSLTELFIPTEFDISGNNFVMAIRQILQWDWLIIFSACFIWLAYSFWDLKAAGMVKQSWLTLFAGCAASFATVGPGATFAAGWSYREYCLAYRRHKNAIVSTAGSVEKVHANGGTRKS